MGYQSAYKNSKMFQPQKFYAYDNAYMHEIASCCHVIILLLVTLELGSQPCIVVTRYIYPIPNVMQP